MNIPIAYFPSNNILFIGCVDSLILRNEPMDTLDSFLKQYQGKYVFTAFGYDLKNQIEVLSSIHKDAFDFPDVLAFVPEQVIQLKDEQVDVLQGSNEISSFVYEFILKIKCDNSIEFPSISLSPVIDKETYVKRVLKVQEEIQYGNCYELNFCQQYLANEVYPFDTFGVFLNLYEKTKSPFSVYFKYDEWEVMCLSPERYIQRKGNRLISQPIKGTIGRGGNPSEDIKQQEILKADPKERSENVMIVDLVRNDLSKIATRGSVQVDELFGVYQFETLHHMISTISCELKENSSLVDCLKATFPMGSMTGAPKKMVMELIEKYESFKRGLYSGSIGYIEPSGDFDLNVVIRSLFYNNQNQTLSCAVGSAITIKALPEKEYDECGVKVGNLIRSFQV